MGSLSYSTSRRCSRKLGPPHEVDSQAHTILIV